MLAIANVEMAGMWDGEADEWIADADRYDTTDRRINARFGAMSFADPPTAFANIRHSLRPGGRIALLWWQRFEVNEWLTTVFDALDAGRNLPTPPAGAPGPFGLADAEAVTTLLHQAGFVDGLVTSISEPLWLGDSADDAWPFVSDMGFVRGLTDGLDDESREQAMAELHRRISANETTDGVLLGSAAWLITARQR